MSAWDEAKHPRLPSGKHGGGEFASLAGAAVHAHLGKPDLTPQQAKSLDRYQQTLYHQLNAYHWTGDPHAADAELGSHTVSEAELKKVSAHLDEAFRKAKPTTKPMVVYRGMSGTLSDPKPGSVLTSKGYMSTAPDPASIGIFTWNKEGTEQERPLRISVPAGSKAISVYNTQPGGNAAEGEVLFPRGSELKITAVGRDYIDAVIVPGSGISRSHAEYVARTRQMCAEVGLVLR